MSQYWSKLVQKLDPYVPGEQPQDKKYIKLNTNENPYPPSPKVLDIMKKNANEDMRLYPDPNTKKAVDALANFYNVTSDQVFVGNGSDEVLAFSFQAFFDQDRYIIFPDITYSFYPVYSKLFQIPYELVPLTDDFSIDLEKFKGSNGGIIFPNPNAPTGKLLEIDKIKDILTENKDSVVIVDEAYIDFGGTSAVELVDDFKNLLVIQTFSKSRSLAGLRIGFAIGDSDLIEALNRVKNSFNSYTLDRIAIESVVASINDNEYFEKMTKRVVRTRETTIERLKKLEFQIVPSSANFIFISHPKYGAEQIYNYLKENGILVRYFNKARINQFLRVSIGTPEEMEEFFQTLTKYINENI